MSQNKRDEKADRVPAGEPMKSLGRAGQATGFVDNRPTSLNMQSIQRKMQAGGPRLPAAQGVVQAVMTHDGKNVDDLAALNVALGKYANVTNYPAGGLLLAHFANSPTAAEVDDAIEAIGSSIYDYMDVNDVVADIDTEVLRVQSIPPVTLSWSNSSDDGIVSTNWPKLYAKLSDPTNYDSSTGKPGFNVCHVDDTGAAQWKLQADQELLGAGSVDRMHLDVTVDAPGKYTVTIVQISYNTH